MNMLESLEETHPLSPLSSTVHDDFSSLSDPNNTSIDESQLTLKSEDDQDNLVSTAIPDVDDDPIALVVAQDEIQVRQIPELHEEDGTNSSGHEQQPSLTEVPVNQVVSSGEQENGIIFTTDADGNLAVPISTDQVIHFLMQTADGNMVAADASMGALKLSLSNLIQGGDGGQSIQALTLADGTTTLVQTAASKEDTAVSKLIEGQAVKLENGTTALLQAQPRETSLHAVQFEDGSTAFIAHPNTTEGIFTDTSSVAAPTVALERLNPQPVINTDKTNEKAIVMSDKAYKCMYEECGRLYTTLHHLKVHERSHTGDRPFLCDFANCGKAFATGYGLKSHKRVHTGEKPYPCTENGCKKAFKTSGDLQKHVRTHTGERPFKCPFEGCARSFTTSNIRKVHIRTHTGERPYVCEVEGCGRAFASATNYKNHIRIHTGEKPYACAFLGCGKRFTEYSSLYKHHVVHTHTKPYTCSHCGKTYRQTSTLAMHKRTTHGDDTSTEISTNETSVSIPNSSETATSSTSGSQQPAPKKPKIIKEEKLETSPEVSPTATETPPSIADTVHQMLFLAPQVNTQGVSDASSPSEGQSEGSLANIFTLQGLETLQQAGLTGLPGLAISENGQQVFVVTDPAQLEALRQITAQSVEPLGSGSELLQTGTTTDETISPGTSLS